MADNRKEEIMIIDEELLRNKIYPIRSQQVMLDFDLAQIYEYTTSAFNQQVNRNIEKFDEDFMFRLTREELENLISQNVISSWGGRRKLPYREISSTLDNNVTKADLSDSIKLFDIGIEHEEILILDGEPFKADLAYQKIYRRAKGKS